MKKTASLALLLLLGLVMPVYAHACDAAGANTHVGQVLSVDGDRFTIRDAQSGGPISFTFNQKTGVPVAGDRVQVNYSKTKEGLVAESVR